MSTQFEWSESGLRLLDIINKVIEDNGGVNEMYSKVLVEASESMYQRDRFELKQRITMLRGKVNILDMPRILGISETQLYNVLHELNIVRPCRTRRSSEQPEHLQQWPDQ